MEQVKRLSVSLPPEVEKEVVNLRKQEKYCRCSYSEIIRILIKAGAAALDVKAECVG